MAGSGKCDEPPRPLARERTHGVGRLARSAITAKVRCRGGTRMTKALPHIDAVGPPGAKAAPEEGAGDGELSDVALVAALRARDESAFANPVRRYQRAMLAVANRYVSRPGDGGGCGARDLA